MDSIGRLFLKARRHKKISLDKAARETKIKKEYLKALEEENFNQLPGSAYVRAFLIKYAGYLEIKPEKILNLYKAKKPPAVKKTLLNFNYSKFLPRHRRKNYLGLLILLLLISVIMFTINRSKEIPPVPASLNTESKVLPEKPSSQPVNLKIRAKEKSSIQVKEGEKIIFDGIINKNEEKQWGTKEKFVLRIDNAGAIELEVNGNFIGAVGVEDELIPALVITPDAIYFDE